MKKILILIGSLVLILIIVKQFQSNSVSNNSPDEYSIIATAEEFIKQKLKSPSTAEFSSLGESKVNQFENGECWVSGYVDAQNSFGAMIRNNYVVKMRYNNNGTFSLIDLRLE